MHPALRTPPLRHIALFGRATTALLLVALTVGCGDDPLPEDTSPDVSVDPGDDLGGDTGEPTLDMGADDAGEADAGEVDAGEMDAGTSDGGGQLPPSFPTVYPGDELLSPMSRHVVENLRTIAERDAGLQDDVFAKVGASNTVNTNFMTCFASDGVRLDGRGHLVDPIAFYLQGDAAGTSPYERESLAASVGKSAGWALDGTPSPLDRELDAIDPRIALIHYGTNDINLGDIHRYGANLLDMVDTLSAGGVLPVLTTLPPRDDDPDADAWVPRYNAVQLAVAQSRQLPLVHLWLALAELSDHGLGPDGIHLNAAPTGACDFTASGLQYGHNVRNLYTIETLARLRQRVLEAEDIFEPSGAPRRGDGSPTDPIVVDGFPFADTRNTATGGTRLVDSYPGCMASQNEGGREFLYRFTLERPTTIYALVLDRGGVDIDIHLLDDTADPTSGCIARDHIELEEELAPGTYHLSLDTFVSGSGTVNSGEYTVVLLTE
jgi:hypothetical protein